MFLRVVVCLKILENEATAPLQTFGSHTITAFHPRGSQCPRNILLLYMTGVKEEERK
jgi:hypothetical protein